MKKDIPQKISGKERNHVQPQAASRKKAGWPETLTTVEQAR